MNITDRRNLIKDGLKWEIRVITAGEGNAHVAFTRTLKEARETTGTSIEGSLYIYRLDGTAKPQRLVQS